MRRNHLPLLLAAMLAGHATCVRSVSAVRPQAIQSSQTEEVGVQAARVKAAIAGLAARPKARVRVTLDDLSEFEGRAADPGEDSFVLVVRIAKGTFVERRVAYAEVVELRGGGFSVSFIPDPLSRPYGSWEAVRRLGFGDSVEVLLASGRRLRVRINSSTDTSLSLLKPDGTTTEHDWQDVVRVSRVGDGSGGAGTGAARGMARGMRARELAPTRQGKAIAAGFGAGIGAGVGALAGAARKKGHKRLLLYAK